MKKVVIKVEGAIVGEKIATPEEIRKMQNAGITIIPVR